MERDGQPLEMAEQIPRMAASTLASGRATSHRLSPKSSASVTPRASSMPAPSHTPPGSWSVTGPSTIHFRTMGKTSDRQEATTATAAAPPSGPAPAVRTATGAAACARRTVPPPGRVGRGPWPVHVLWASGVRLRIGTDNAHRVSGEPAPRHDPPRRGRSAVSTDRLMPFRARWAMPPRGPRRDSRSMTTTHSAVRGDRPLIEVAGLRKVYAGRAVVDDLSFTVGEGEIFGILGPNGSRQDDRGRMRRGAARPRRRPRPRRGPGPRRRPRPRHRDPRRPAPGE